jgi:hypothetical protein
MPALTKPQWDFLSDRTTPNLAFSGGMGAGKSFAGAMKSIDMALSNVGHPFIVWAPTISMAKDGVIRAAVQLLRGEHESGFHIKTPFDYNKSTGQITLYPLGRKGKASEIIIRSAEQDIVSTNACGALADELDTLPKLRAHQNWQQLTQRVRAGQVRQLCATTTPEGYRFLWSFFVQDPQGTPELAASRRLITASLLSNPYVDDSYIRNLILSHTPEQQRARIHGEFVNLGNSRVYEYYDRQVNGTGETLADYPKADLWVGLDFNVNKMAAVIGVYLPNKLLILDELIGTKEQPILDTPTMIKLLKQRYPTRRIHICPDASGENRNANGWLTSIGELQRAGFTCHHDASNPRVDLRVSNVNRMLFNVHQKNMPELYVNDKYCPFVTEVLEQQPYNAKGEPDKDSGLDHAGDALGYLVMQTFGARLAQATNAPWRH